MGQKRTVQVINLISSDTIEHQMLGKLHFKSAMAMGVLDNGEQSVFLHESKFNALMKEVTTLTETSLTRNRVSPDEDDGGPDPVAFRTEAENTPVDSSSIETRDFLSTASHFFSELTQVLSEPSRKKELLDVLVKTDEHTGQCYLQLPVRNMEVVETGLHLIAQLLAGSK